MIASVGHSSRRAICFAAVHTGTPAQFERIVLPSDAEESHAALFKRARYPRDVIRTDRLHGDIRSGDPLRRRVASGSVGKRAALTLPNCWLQLAQFAAATFGLSAPTTRTTEPASMD